MPADPEVRLRAALDELADALVALARESRPSADAGAPIQLLSVPEAARRLAISRSSAYVALGSGRLRSVKVGGRRLVPSSEVSRLAAGDAPDQPAAPRRAALRPQRKAAPANDLPRAAVSGGRGGTRPAPA
jgi:excisionase family DNA binding protein